MPHQERRLNVCYFTFYRATAQQNYRPGCCAASMVDDNDGGRKNGRRSGAHAALNHSRTAASRTAGGGEFPLPRLVRRNLPFSQSRNQIKIDHNHRFRLLMLRRHDWFHVLLRASTWLSFLFLLFIWTSILFMFAGFYVLVDNRNPDVYCGLGPVGSPIQYGPAFAFSLETCATGTSSAK